MAYSEGESRKGLAYDESEVLAILKAEREASTGFDLDATLNDDRERALNYYKGEMTADMPVLENRSSVVSTDVADAIETALPDLIDVFLAGEDGMTFQATGAEDEDQAKQETDYVRHVIFQQNRGFHEFYTAFKDALLLKTGVWKFYWDGEPEYQEYEAEVDDLGLQELQQMGIEIVSIEPMETAPGGYEAQDDLGPEDMGGEQGEQGYEEEEPGEQQAFGMYRITARKMIRNGMVRMEAIPPEDFTVSDDTVRLPDTPYCAYRRRCRVQDLLTDGYDADKVAQLYEHETTSEEIIRQARDTAGEHSEHQFSNAAIEELRQVEVVEHYVRIDLEDTGRPQIWRVVTGNNEACILEIEKRSRIEFAAITPYPQTHRFYGQSLADKTLEIQKWKTSLIRMLNDSGYFALNQRAEVDITGCTEDTIPALIDNTPGRPVPVKRQGTISPIQTAGPSFDMLAAIEFANTVSEQRTGVVRNAQGLNPDTLHDTAKGAQILIGAAQKRIRMMARQFAEGGVRDLFLGIHDLLRSNATMGDTIRLRNKWIDVDPSTWGRRKDVSIEIGIGSGGREEKMVKFNLFAERIAQIVEMQQGWKGPIVTEQNIYSLAEAFGDALDIKSPERFLNDPSQNPPQEEDGPDPEAQAMMAKVQMEQQKAQADFSLDQQKAVAQIELEKQKAAANLQAQRDKAALDAQIARERHQQEIQLAREKAAAEVELAREKMENEVMLARERADMEGQIAAFKAQNEATMTANRPGGSLAE